MRIGVLGGSFNPPHIGHLLIATDAFESLSLDRLMVIPAAANPLKELEPGAPAPEQRLDMARLAFGDDTRFEVTSMEIDRGGLSYTVDTLETLAGRNPGAELVLLLGIDAYRGFDRWKEPGRIRELARIAVFLRGDDASMPAGAVAVTARRIDVSSTEIRARVAGGLPIRGFVAESVEDYISTAKLYRSRAAAVVTAVREGKEETRNA
jgi:nicotinate-nucleotide adenylyltransferase